MESKAFGHMGYQGMFPAPRVRSAIAAIMLAFALPAPAGASEPDLDGFRVEIDAFIGRLGRRRM